MRTQKSLGLFVMVLMAFATVSVYASKDATRALAANGPITNQRIVRWEGACARCGEFYSWLGEHRPAQQRCNKCQGAIIWQPVYQ
jgi:hypothetical protein